jgi:hypothetical protein
MKIGSIRRAKLLGDRHKHHSLTFNSQKPLPNSLGGKLNIPTEISESNKVDKRVHSGNMMYYDPKSNIAVRANS